MTFPSRQCARGRGVGCRQCQRVWSYDASANIGTPPPDWPVPHPTLHKIPEVGSHSIEIHLLIILQLGIQEQLQNCYQYNRNLQSSSPSIYYRQTIPGSQLGDKLKTGSDHTTL